MNALVNKEDRAAIATSAMSHDELHNRASRTIDQAHGAVFNNLPGLITQIIMHKVWKTRQTQFKNFGEYALNQGVDGLCISNDQRLWILRCAMDVHGEHMAEWGDVLSEVEKAVRVYLRDQSERITGIGTNALETLANKCVPGSVPESITYLPSRASMNSLDKKLVTLRGKNPSTYRQVVRRKIDVSDGLASLGLPTRRERHVSEAKTGVRKMNKKQLQGFIDWMVEEGFLK